jgi:hypothetical protein
MKRVFLLEFLLVVPIMWTSLAFRRVPFTPILHLLHGGTSKAPFLRQVRTDKSRIGASSTTTRLFGGGRNRDGLGKAKGYSDANSRYILQKHTKSGLPDRDRPFLVLGIESSCDDTGAAIVRSDGTVLSNVVYSQYEIHERFGGIVPSLAMEAHKTNIDKAVTEALAQVQAQTVYSSSQHPSSRGLVASTLCFLCTSPLRIPLISPLRSPIHSTPLHSTPFYSPLHSPHHFTLPSTSFHPSSPHLPKS